ncbi:MAG TPA: ABC transporter ATP-binding protein [Clostridiales bacterium]|nr:ABC transporter ATP-binding protein [Clostridiales bacterium]
MSNNNVKTTEPVVGVNDKENINEPFLKVEDLVVEYTSYGEIIHAVNGVSLQLERGKTLGLVGETGAGKTTIAKSILGILPKFSSSIKRGQVFIDGQDLLSLPEKEMQKIRGNKIAMIFQDPMTALNPIIPVGKQISEAIQLHYNVSAKESAERAIEMLEMAGITGERYNDYPHQFSGGMKQRVVIAMALACRPELLLADEPTTALDVTIQAQILEMIKELRDKFNMALILITHDFGVVAELCDEVAVVYAGEIIESGTKEDIFIHPTHPYTIGLFDSIPHIDSDADRLKPIAGLPPNPAVLPKGCHFSPRCPKATDECRDQPIPMVETSPGHFCRCCHI